MHAITLCSINRARPQQLDVGGKRTESGIFKTPVDGAVAIGTAGLHGDAVCDLSRHGGADQAIYLHSAQDLAWWSGELQRVVGPGYFGENLTIARWWPSPRVGDRIVLGAVVLEVTFARVPCATLAARVGDAHFLKRFVAARRPGLYARVLQDGVVQAGMQGAVHAAPENHPTTDALFRCWHASPRDPALLRAALQAPIAERARAAFTRWLDGAPAGPRG